MQKQTQFSLLWYLILAFMVAATLQNYLASPREAQLPYSDFKQLLKDGAVQAVTIGQQQIHGTLSLSQTLPSGLSRNSRDELGKLGAGNHGFVTNRVEDPDLVKELGQANVKYQGKAESHWLASLLSWILPLFIFILIWSFMLRRMGGAGGGTGLLSIGKSRAKVYMETDTRVTFNDVAGVDEAKLELKEVVEFLKDPKRYGRLGARIPKGVLLVGPPGTGKTLLARAVAGEAEVPFFSISGSEFVEMFVGVGAARVRDLFEQGRSKAPAIIFIDELDALGRARAANPVGGVDEKEQTLNQLLVEMDGFDPSSGLILLAATNRPEILDPALLRAGRFDRQVLVDRPDRPGRAAILQVHMHKVQLAADVDAEQIAALTPGFTGADLANLVNEAALLATRRDASSVEQQDFTNAIERIVAGLEKKQRLMNPKEREVIAYHEMGHTLTAMSLSDVDPVHKVSIIPRGVGALGYTLQRPTQDRFLMTEEELEHRMIVLLGGRAAEFLVFNRFSTGATDDLAKATDIARHMVMRYGMDEHLGHVVYDNQTSPYLPGAYTPPPARDFSESTAAQIDESVRLRVQAAFDKALQMLQSERNVLEKGAKLLLEKETLGEAELHTLLADRESGTPVAR